MNKIILALLLAPSAAYAGGTAIAQQNAVSSATGGAGAARDDDAGAAWYDPAALADGGGLRMGLMLAFARPALQARSDDGTWSTDSDAKWKTPFHLDASYARDRWAAGLSVGAPFGGGVTWPTTWTGSTQAVRSDLLVLRAAPFFAYNLGRIRVGGGLHVDAARLQVQRNLDFIDTRGDVRLDLAGQGIGAHASLYWQPQDSLGIGVAFRSRTKITLSGNANFTSPDAFSGKTPDQQAKTTMTLPDVLVVGGRWRNGNLAVLGDVEYTNWSVNEKTEIDFAQDATPNAMQPNDWHDTLALRTGVEYTRSRIVVRGGGYYDPSPVPAAHLTPTAPDSTRLAATAGVSYQIAPAWAADLFGEHMWLVRRDTTSADTMPASYGGTALVIGAGVRWTPTPR
jgi:long-chain fatty acid transport protein